MNLSPIAGKRFSPGHCYNFALYVHALFIILMRHIAQQGNSSDSLSAPWESCSAQPACRLIKLLSWMARTSRQQVPIIFMRLPFKVQTSWINFVGLQQAVDEKITIPKLIVLSRTNIIALSVKPIFSGLPSYHNSG